MSKYDTSSTHVLSARKLARLIGMMTEEGQPASSESLNDQAAQLLRDWLDGPMTICGVAGAMEVLAAASGDSGREAPTIGHILLSGQGELDDLRKIKEWGKTLARRNKSEPCHTVAIVLYYGAIASALLQHGARITSYSYKALAESLRNLVHKPWMSPRMGSHFARAADLCDSESP